MQAPNFGIYLWFKVTLKTLVQVHFIAFLTTGHGTTDWFQIEKKYVKAVYCHPACLT